MQINKVNNIHFGAIPIAKAEIKNKFIHTNPVNGTKHSFKLFALSQKDNSFLQELLKRINLHEYAAGFLKQNYDLWQSVIIGCFANLSGEKRKNMLCTYNGIPCGAISSRVYGNNNVFVDYAASWPIKKGKKAPLGNQVLFHKLFRDCLKENQSEIMLDAITDSPGNPVIKYQKLGFKPSEEIYDEQVFMRINKEKIAEKIKELNIKISSKDIDSSEEIDLYKELELNF